MLTKSYFFIATTSLVASALYITQPAYAPPALAANGDVSLDHNGNVTAIEGLVADNNGLAPTLDVSANNTPVVNIRAANSSGVSHNQFDSYNIGKNHLILNNSVENGVSQTGGVVTYNPNLLGAAAGYQPERKDAQAKIILNEVTGTSRTTAEGFTEVFGGRADVLVVNPNGITCNGCGFINTNRVHLGTGKATVNGDNIELDVSSGDVKISGTGINLNGNTASNNTDYFEIVARAIEITGELKGREELRLIAGQNKYDYKTKKVTEKTANGSAAPAVAIDAKALGAMNANRIHVVSTEDGVGVNFETNIAADVGDIIINADGKIVNKGGIEAKKNLVITTTGDIENTNNINAEDNVTLTAENLFNQTGDVAKGISAKKQLQITAAKTVKNNLSTLTASKNITIKAKDIDNISGHILSEQADVILEAEKLNNEAGKVISQKKLDIDATTVTNKTASELSSVEGDIDLDATSVTNDGKIEAFAGSVDVNSTSSLKNNKGQVKAKNNITLTQNELALTNSSIVSTQEGNILLQANAANVNSSTVQSLKGNIVLNGDNYTVTSSSVIAHNLLDNNAKKFTNQSSSVLRSVAGDVDSDNTSFINVGSASVSADAGNIDITSSVIENKDSWIESKTGTVSLNASTTKIINNGGGVKAKGDITITSASLQGEMGTLAADKIILNMQNASVLRKDLGTLAAETLFKVTNFAQFINDKDTDIAGDIEIIATNNADIVNKKILKSKSNITLTSATGNINNENGAEINAQKNVQISGVAIDNKDKIIAQEQLQITGNQIDNIGSNALLFSGKDLKLFASDITNKDLASIYAREGNIVIAKNSAMEQANKLENLNGAEIEATVGDVSINALNISNVSEGVQINSRSFNYNFFSDNVDIGQWGITASGATRNVSAKYDLGITQFFIESGNSNISKILAGKNATLTASNKVINDQSEISASKDLKLVSPLIENKANGLKDTTYNVNVAVDFEVFAGESCIGQLCGDAYVPVSINLKDSDPNFGKYTSGPGTFKLLNSYNNFNSSFIEGPTGQPFAIPSYINSNSRSVTLDTPSGFGTGVGAAILNAGGNLQIVGALVNSGIAAGADLSATGTSLKNQTFASQSLATDAVAVGTSSPQGNSINISLFTGTEVPDPGSLFNIKSVPSSSTAGGPSYLIETDPNLVNLTNYLGSDYLLRKLGYEDKIEDFNFLGDAKYEEKLLRDQSIKQFGRSYFIEGATSQEEQRQKLYDNAIQLKEKMPISVGVALTADQVALLSEPILWYEKQVVGGHEVLAPVVYLPKAYAQNISIKNGGILKGNDVTIDVAGDVDNEGKINAKKYASVKAKNISNKGNVTSDGALQMVAESIQIASNNGKSSNLSAKDELSLRATKGSLSIEGGHLTSGKNLKLEANQGSVIIVDKKQASKDYLLASREASTIKSGKNLVIDAAQDIDITSSELEAKETAYLKANGNVRIRDRNYHEISRETRSESSTGPKLSDIRDSINQGSAKKDADWSLSSTTRVESKREAKSTSIGSSIKSGKHLVVSSEGNIDVTGSKLKAQGTALLDAKKDVNIQAGKTRKVTNTHESELKLSAKLWENGNSNETTKEVKEIANSSRIEGGDVVVRANDQVNIIGSDIHSSSGSSLVSADKVAIKAIDLQNDKTEKSYSSRFSVYAGANTSSKKTNKGNDVKKSKLSSNNDIVVKAKEDLNISGSDLVAKGGALLKSDSGSVTINTAQKKNDITSKSSGRGSSTTGINTQLRIVNKKGKANSTNHVTSTISTGKDLSISAAKNVNITSADLVSGESIIVDAGEDVKFDVAKNTSSSSNTTKTHGFGFTINPVNQSAGAKYTYDKKKKGGSTESAVTNFVAAGKNIQIKSGKDTSIKGTLSHSKGTTLIDAVGKVTIASAEETTKTNTDQTGVSVGVSGSKGSGPSGAEASLAWGERKQNKTRHVLSTMSAEKNFVVRSQSSDVGIKGAVLDASSGVLAIDAAKNITIESVQNSADSRVRTVGGGISAKFEKDAKTKKKGASGGMVEFMARNGRYENEKSIQSSLQGYNVALKSGEDVTMKGAKVAAHNDLGMSVGGDLNILAAKDKKDTRNIIFNASASSNKDSKKQGSSHSAGNIGGRVDRTKNTTHLASLITAGNNASINVSDNANIKGSSVEVHKSLEMNVGKDLKVETKKDSIHENGVGLSLSHKSNSTDGRRKNDYKYSTNSAGIDGSFKNIGEVNHIAGIRSGDEMKVDVKGGTTLKGGEIFSKSNKLNLTTNSLEQESVSATGSYAGLKADVTKKNVQNPSGFKGNSTIPVPTGAGYQEQEQIVRSVIGEGNVTIGGKKLEYEKDVPMYFGQTEGIKLSRNQDANSNVLSKATLKGVRLDEFTSSSAPTEKGYKGAKSSTKKKHNAGIRSQKYKEEFDMSKRKGPALNIGGKISKVAKNNVKKNLIKYKDEIPLMLKKSVEHYASGINKRTLDLMLNSGLSKGEAFAEIHHDTLKDSAGNISQVADKARTAINNAVKGNKLDRVTRSDKKEKQSDRSSSDLVYLLTGAKKNSSAKGALVKSLMGSGGINGVGDGLTNVNKNYGMTAKDTTYIDDIIDQKVVALDVNGKLIEAEEGKKNKNVMGNLVNQIFSEKKKTKETINKDIFDAELNAEYGKKRSEQMSDADKNSANADAQKTSQDLSEALESVSKAQAKDTKKETLIQGVQ